MAGGLDCREYIEAAAADVASEPGDRHAALSQTPDQALKRREVATVVQVLDQSHSAGDQRSAEGRSPAGSVNATRVGGDHAGAGCCQVDQSVAVVREFGELIGESGRRHSDGGRVGRGIDLEPLTLVACGGDADHAMIAGVPHRAAKLDRRLGHGSC